MDDHAAVLERVEALINREHVLRIDAGEVGTPVTAQGLALIVYGALVALESGDVDVAKGLLAGDCAMLSEASRRC